MPIRVDRDCCSLTWGPTSMCFIGMLATNDQCKEMLAPSLGNGWATTLTASAISGFFAVTLSLPFDFLKTR